jgi:hypothetical protein
MTLKSHLVTYPNFPNVIDMIESKDKKLVLFDELSLDDKSPVQEFIKTHDLQA